MTPRRKTLLFLCSLSWLLPACAPSLPLLAIGAVTYLAQTHLTRPQEDPAEPPAKTGTAVKRQKAASPTLTQQGPRKLPTSCRHVDGGTKCKIS